jgi:glycosyltransferase involved in cell wall biosynthesis
MSELRVVCVDKRWKHHTASGGYDLLLPMLEATANNAALEALACGTPVISTMVGGTPDYVDNTCGWMFEKGEVGGIVKLIGEICTQPEVVSSRRSAARSKGLVFSWKRVAAKIRLVYEAVARHQLSRINSWETEIESSRLEEDKHPADE